MQTTQKDSIKNENYIIELFKIILPYKWSIIFITLLTISLTYLYLYFIPSTYQSSSIIKVKTDNNSAQTSDLVRDSLNSASTIGIKQEMLSLQTFKTNKEALKEVDFSIQYFQKHNYKMLELYNDSPVHIELTKEVNLHNIRSQILLTPRGEGFTITTEENSASDTYAFNTEVETPYFAGIVTIQQQFINPIYLKFNGNARNIYQGIISNSLSVSQIDLNANLIKISFQDTVPARANSYIDALVNIYLSQNLQKKDDTNSKVLNFLDVQLENIKEKLEKSENELESYKTLNSVEPTVKSKDSFEKLSAIDLDLSELTLKEKLAKNLVTFVRNNRNLDAIGPTLLEFNDQATIKFIDRLEELQQEEDELKLEFTDQYPKLISLKKRIRKTKSKIMLNIKNLKSTLVAKRQSLEKQKKKYERILKELPKKEKKLVHFQRDYEVNSKMYTYLLQKKSENELIKVASVSNYEIIDKAYTPLSPIKPKRLVALIIASIIGFFIALLISLLRALFVDKIAAHKDIKVMTKLPVYGVIPIYKDHLFSTSKLKEAYHKLATNLQFSKKENVGSIILLSSQKQGEGKTTTTVNLAGVFQNSQYKTIVIDLNMREPALHGHFGIEQQYSGMSTYLSQRDNIGNIIFSTNYNNLDIISAGPIPPNPYELVLSNRLPELFEILKKKYDYIFIDTGPYDTAEETLYLMQFTTMNLIVLREKVSKKSTLVELDKLIYEKNLKNMGLVLKSIIKEKKEDKHELLMAASSNTEASVQKQVPSQLR